MQFLSPVRIGGGKKKRILCRNSLPASDLIKNKVWMTFINAINMIKILLPRQESETDLTEQKPAKNIKNYHFNYEYCT